MELRKQTHTPPHLFVPNSKYFITASILNRVHVLSDEITKRKLLEILFKAYSDNGWKLEDWVIMDNHYHLMADSNDNAAKLSGIVKEVHKFSAMWIKKNVRTAFGLKRIWYNYWDTCVTYERSYFCRLNYIWFNPVKHGYVKYPQDWKFGSFRERFITELDYLNRVNKEYPWDKVKIEDDF